MTPSLRSLPCSLLSLVQDSVPWLTNELVNVINTIIGAVVAIGIMVWLG